MTELFRLREEKMQEVHGTIGNGPFKPDWDSLRDYSVPRWYEDAKFGIFIHWGVYSVPAYDNEWYPRNMYIEGTPAHQHHIAAYGPVDKFGYKDFIPHFTAENFDPEVWADLFKSAGAAFVVPVAEHHDGFGMYDCPFSDWTAAKMGPQRDIIGELADAVRRRYMTFGVSSHRAENWWYYNGGRELPSDVQDPRYAGLYGPAQRTYGEPGYPQPILPPSEEFLEDWLARTCDLIDRYGPQLVYFDWWIEQPVFKPYLQKLAAYYYNKAAEWGRGVVVNYKLDAFAEGTAVYDMERGQLADIHPDVWQTCTSVGETAWCHIADHKYKTSAALIGDLVDIVSKNGVMLLNVGPRADGTIPGEERKLLLEIGEWLAVNGEAIYSTRPWKVYGEGPTEIVSGTFNDTKRSPFTAKDVRFTARGDKLLYALIMGWPDEGRALIETLSSSSRLFTGQIMKVQVLGWKEELSWSRKEDGLHVLLPEALRARPVIAVRIEYAVAEALE
ncbi:alpha-L-fucosidase [Paenibacillus medicaginis]|uniref:alpha-L-fucosidase n=1 Tax=Paenibacillus medicaginis TaxID=1470560 RepID=A0ABV5C5U1_9BACL